MSLYRVMYTEAIEVEAIDIKEAERIAKDYRVNHNKPVAILSVLPFGVYFKTELVDIEKAGVMFPIHTEKINGELIYKDRYGKLVPRYS